LQKKVIAASDRNSGRNIAFHHSWYNKWDRSIDRKLITAYRKWNNAIFWISVSNLYYLYTVFGADISNSEIPVPGMAFVRGRDICLKIGWVHNRYEG